jgi:hypothetical protein
MKKSNKVFPVFLILTLGILFMLVSCGNQEETDEQEEPTEVFEAKTFSVANYNFAILENKKFIQYNKAIYHRGDEVYLVLENVGPFMVGNDSLNHAEMKIHVSNAIGKTVVLRESVLGDRGKKRFIGNILASPYGSFSSSASDLPGKYTFCITIYDLVKKDSIVVCDDFFLE